MADAVNITAEARDPAKNKGTGSRASNKLRAMGRIPAVIYGHKQPTQTISLSRDDVLQMIKKKTHLAQLSWGSGSDMVMVKAIQWDHLGKEILHLDFARVSADEAIETEVPLVAHGTAPGLAGGGILEMVLHALTVSCRPTAIPDSIRVEVGHLNMNEAVHARELALPEGVMIVGDGDRVVAHVVPPKVEPEATDEPAASEPEVIGRKAEEKKDE